MGDCDCGDCDCGGCDCGDCDCGDCDCGDCDCCDCDNCCECGDFCSSLGSYMCARSCVDLCEVICWCCIDSAGSSRSNAALQPDVAAMTQPMIVPQQPVIVTQPTLHTQSPRMQQPNGPTPSAPKEEKRRPESGDGTTVDHLPPPSYEDAVASAPPQPQH